ncbi:MAG: hypothetical protein RL199_1754, partial [Pseudomonadota bacterium]
MSASWLRHAFGFALALPLFGCGALGGLEALRAGLPADEDVKLAVPERSGAQALVGQQADLYGMTRGVTVGVNGGVLWALGLVRRIASMPPTTHPDATHWTWGPSTPRNLEPKNNYQLEASLNDDGSVSYALAGKTVEAETFHTLIAGTHAKGAVPRSGNGTLDLDWDASHELHKTGRQVGHAHAQYGYKAGDGYTVAVDFTQIRDGDSDRLVDATYRFSQPVAGTGTLLFTTQKDLTGDARLETLTIFSRWLESGRGRGDARATG